MSMNRKLAVVGLAVLVLFLAGCAASPNPNVHTPGPEGGPAGFWLGFWHGLILPITWIISLFTSRVGVYEVHNNGGWYNAGFGIGAGILHVARSGPERARRLSRKRDTSADGGGT